MIPFVNITKLTQFYDIQGFLDIKIGDTLYSSIGAQPRFLSIANFSQSNAGGLDYAASMDVTLSDYDGAFKALMDAGTLLDQPVEIWQRFDDSEGADTLFTGRVTTPITWQESDRTIQFTIENGAQDVLLNDNDPEDDCEPEYIPFVFGDYLGVKAVNSAGGCKKESALLKPILHTVINSQSGKITYASGDLYVRNGRTIFGEDDQILIVDGTLFHGSFTHETDETRFVLVEGGFNSPFRVGGIDFTARDESDTQDYTNASIAWVTEEAYDIPGKFVRIQFQTEYWYHTNSDDSRSPTTENDPTGTKTVETVATAIKINGIEGTKASLEFPPLDRFGRPVLLGWEKESSILEIKGKIDYSWNPAPTYNYPYRWEIPSGTKVEVYSGANTTWYFNQTSSQAIINVYGTRNGKLAKIPSNWYTTTLTGPTSITFDRNLVGKGQFDSNQVFADITSWLGSNNIATVIKWLAENYCTDLTVDNASYLIAESTVSTLPCGFVVIGQKRSFDLMKELAWQGGLSLTVRNGVLYFKDITTAPINTGDADYVVTNDKTEFRSCVINTTNESDVITHFIGKYYESGYPNDIERKIIRINTNKDKFKKNVFEYDFFAFNQKDCVIRVVEFYLSRLTNIWQQASLKTFLTTLNLNPADKVMFELDYVAATYGLITGVDYDPANWDCTIKVETDKGLYSGSYWGTLVGTTPGSIFKSNEVEVDVVFDDLSRSPIVQLLPTKFFYDTDPNQINPIDVSNIDTTRDSALVQGKVTGIYDNYLEVTLVDPNDPTKTLNWDNYSPVNILPTSQKPTTTIKVAKAKKVTGA